MNGLGYEYQNDMFYIAIEGVLTIHTPFIYERKRPNLWVVQRE